MRIAIVADVHANLVALEAVLRHAEAQGACDDLWCLADIVGYGPQPYPQGDLSFSRSQTAGFVTP